MSLNRVYLNVVEGFKLLPKRLVIERTWDWLNWSRRLSKNYEVLPETSETFIYVAMIRNVSLME